MEREKSRNFPDDQLACFKVTIDLQGDCVPSTMSIRLTVEEHSGSELIS